MFFKKYAPSVSRRTLLLSIRRLDEFLWSFFANLRWVEKSLVLYARFVTSQTSSYYLVLITLDPMWYLLNVVRKSSFIPCSDRLFVFVSYRANSTLELDDNWGKETSKLAVKVSTAAQRFKLSPEAHPNSFWSCQIALKRNSPSALPLSNSNLPNFQPSSSSNIHIPSPGKCDLKATKWHSTIVRNIRRNAPETRWGCVVMGVVLVFSLSLLIRHQVGFQLRASGYQGNGCSRQRWLMPWRDFGSSTCFACCRRGAKLFLLKPPPPRAGLKDFYHDANSKGHKMTQHYRDGGFQRTLLWRSFERD